MAALVASCDGSPTTTDAGRDDRAPVADLPSTDAQRADAGSTSSDLGGDPPDARPDAAWAPPYGGEVCAEVDRFVPQYASTVARWAAQDAEGPWPRGGVVFVGSSSIRRWAGLARSFSDYDPIQRGMGGAQLAEVAVHARALVSVHDPRAVVVFAGTNDIDAGVSPSVVFDRLRCLRWRLGRELGWDRPVLFVGVTPTRARWSQWPSASAFNASAASLADGDPGLRYVDVAPAFLATGSPPDASLFVSDGLHLSESGYALWHRAIRSALEAAARPRPPAGPPSITLASGARVLVDLGPGNTLDGEPTASPDYMGQRWNNWFPIDGGAAVLAGERKRGLVTATGEATGVEVVITGGFLANGRRNGGLLWPSPSRLSTLAVGTATEDFFYTDGPDNPGGLSLIGLDPSRAYTLRLFGAREDPEVRVTRYTVRGAAAASTTLQTSGAGAGAGRDGATTNDGAIAALSGLRPDAWGRLFVDLSIERGAYGYLSLFELIVE
ncbi:MAG: GDSL-type esterase/lipase family protein [Polyangiales bacterium]